MVAAAAESPPKTMMTTWMTLILFAIDEQYEDDKTITDDEQFCIASSPYKVEERAWYTLLAHALSPW